MSRVRFEKKRGRSGILRYGTKILPRIKIDGAAQHVHAHRSRLRLHGLEELRCGMRKRFQESYVRNAGQSLIYRHKRMRRYIATISDGDRAPLHVPEAGIAWIKVAPQIQRFILRERRRVGVDPVHESPELRDVSLQLS